MRCPNRVRVLGVSALALLLAWPVAAQEEGRELYAVGKYEEALAWLESRSESEAQLPLQAQTLAMLGRYGKAIDLLRDREDAPSAWIRASCRTRRI